MDIIDLLQAAPRSAALPDFEAELRIGLDSYWDRARRILDNSGVNLAARERNSSSCATTSSRPSSCSPSTARASTRPG